MEIAANGIPLFWAWSYVSSTSSVFPEYELMITKLLFNKLVSVQTLLLYCMSSDQQRLMKDYFIQVPPGYSKDQVDLVEDVSSVWETKLQAIQAHKSQKEDVKRVLEELKRLPQEEYFLVETK